MKKLRKSLALILLCTLTLSSCKHTYYEYDLEDICKACENHGGVNRFHSDMSDIVIICKSGEVIRLN